MSEIFRHSFEDEADGTAISTATSGPDLFDSVNPGSGTLEYVTPGTDPVALGYGELSTLGGSTPNMRWIPGAPVVTELWGMHLFRMATLPGSNMIIFRTSEADGTGGMAMRINGSNQLLQIQNQSFGLVDSFAHAAVLDEWLRFAWHLDTAAGTATVRLWHGANLLGETADEELDLVAAFGDSILDVRWGPQTNVASQIVDYDSLVLEDTTWPGLTAPGIYWYDPDEMKAEADGAQRQPEFDPAAEDEDPEDLTWAETQALIERQAVLEGIIEDDITQPYPSVSGDI